MHSHDGRGDLDGHRPGPTPASDAKIRVAIVVVGNCASSLIQRRCHYQDAPEDAFVPGLMHVDLGGYHVRDIEFVAAFDVNAAKVGRVLGEAIHARPNNTYRFADVPRLGVEVQRGPTLDGIGKAFIRGEDDATLTGSEPTEVDAGPLTESASPEPVAAAVA